MASAWQLDNGFIDRLCVLLPKWTISMALSWPVLFSLIYCAIIVVAESKADRPWTPQNAFEFCTHTEWEKIEICIEQALNFCW